MRIHPRYFIVVEAKCSLDMSVIRVEEKYDLTINRIVEILLQIALETNKVEDLKDRKPLTDLDAPGLEIFTAVQELEQKHSLTVAESINNLLEVASRTNMYAIRIDRHPDNPNKKGDEE